jgi:glycine/D-amino acid oxidase-like deaminating enzyme
VAIPDVVVVGGGLIGVLTAAELAERGARVVVLEKDDIGFEQSGRSVAAINLPGGEPNDDRAAMLRVSSQEWATFEDRWGCEIDLNSDGWHIVVEDEEDQAWLEVDRATWKETAGFPDGETLDAERARKRFPQLAGPFLALDIRHGGHVDAVMVMRGLREAAVRLGVDLRCGVIATDFSTTGDTITAVKTQGEPLPCGAVIVAAGVWSPHLCDRLGFHIPMQRVRAPAAETGPMPPNTIPGFLRGATFGARQSRNGTIRITGGYRYSAMLHDLSLNDLRDLKVWAPALWQNRKDISLRIDPDVLWQDASGLFSRLRKRDDGVVVPRNYNPPSSPRLRRKQLSDLARIVPAVRSARIHRAFAGIIDLIPDLQPVIGPVPGTTNGFVSTGFSGHGYMYVPGACRALAGLVVDDRTEFDVHRYRPERLGETLQMRDQIF